MAYIRLDAYTADATDLQFTIISPGAENLISLADQLVLDQWVTIEIALTDFVADLSPMGRSFYAENKRVANERIKLELEVALKYPDYKAGLGALVRLEKGL